MNCGSNDHNSYNRTCSELKRQVEIQTIKVTQKVSFSEAVKRSNIQRKTYAQITANNSSTTSTNNKQCQCPHCEFHKIDNNQQRSAIVSSDLNERDKESESMDGVTSSAVGTESPADNTSTSQDGQHSNNS